MPVQTGYIPDDEMPVDPIDESTTKLGPPASVAGIEAIASEPTADEPSIVDICEKLGRPGSFKVTLRSEIPGMLLMRMMKKQAELQKPSAVNDQNAQMEALAVTGDMIMKLVIHNDQARLVDYLEDTDPPIGITELMGLMRELTEMVAGRPTPSA